MNTILLTTGLACMIAAIVGGGLKAFGIELPVLQSLSRQLLLGVVGVALIVWGNLPGERGATMPPAPRGDVTQSRVSIEMGSPSNKRAAQQPSATPKAQDANCDLTRTSLANPKQVKDDFDLLLNPKPILRPEDAMLPELAEFIEMGIRHDLCGPLVARGYTPIQVHTMFLSDLRAAAIQHKLISE